MEVLYILVPLALLLAGAAVGSFFWAVKKDQFSDTRTPAVRILLDDPPVSGESSEPKSSTG